jgi:serine/threonine protein kinase
VVVKGLHKKTQVAVAIKMVHKDQTNREEMFSELSVMSRLKHRNIVLFREIFEKKDHYYVVMELYVNARN